MAAIEAYRHIKEDRPYANCASAVVHALVPQTPLQESVQAVLDDNAQSLIDIAACISYEQARIGNYTAMHAIEPGMSPSYFFRNVQRQTEQSPDSAFYVGGLLATAEPVGHGRYELHVVGVMNHHQGKQNMFTVCDTARLYNRELVRRMTYREMDSRIISPGMHNDYRALALVGYPLADLEHDPDLHGNLSEIEVEMLLAEHKLYETLQRAGLLHLVQYEQ